MGTFHRLGAKLFLKKGVQLFLVHPMVFSFLVDNESGIPMDAISNGFQKALEGLHIDDSNGNLALVFLGQFPNPIGEKKVFLSYIFWILIEILKVSLFLQTHLICNKLTVGSSIQKP